MSRKSAHEITLRDLAKDDQKTVLEIARKSHAQIEREAAEVTALATGKNVDGTKRRKPHAQWKDEEHKGQALFFAVEKAKLEAKYPKTRLVMGLPLFQTGKAGFAGIASGKRANAEGRRKGTWDILYPRARGSYIGLWIEAKILPNDLSGEQADFARDMAEEQYLCFVCYAHDAKELALSIASAVEDYETLR